MDDVEDYKKEFDHDYISNLISEYFSLKLMDKVEKFHMRRKQNQEAIPFEASDTDEEEYSDEDALAAQQRDIDADLNNFDFQNGGIFNKSGGELNAQRRFAEKERRRREKELQRWVFPQHVGSYHAYSSPSLEYSKMICEHVFGLDSAF